MSTNVIFELTRAAWVDVNTHDAGTVTFYHMCPVTGVAKVFDGPPNGTSCTSCNYTLSPEEVQDLLSEAIARIGSWPS